MRAAAGAQILCATHEWPGGRADGWGRAAAVADRLRGGPPFVQPWPRQERVLSRAERLELQQLLAQRGFYKGTPDGQFGGQTREALRGFQASIGTPADGFATADVLGRLRGR